MQHNDPLPLDHPDLPDYLANNEAHDGEYGPANDNGRPRRRYESPRRVDLLLAFAGFDLEQIPPKRRRIALAIVRCYDEGLFDEDDIADIARCTPSHIRRVTSILKDAAFSGTDLA